MAQGHMKRTCCAPLLKNKVWTDGETLYGVLCVNLDIEVTRPRKGSCKAEKKDIAPLPENRKLGGEEGCAG